MEVIKLTPESRPAEMVAWQRSVVLGLLIVLVALFNATLYEIESAPWTSQLEKLATIFGGELLAQASLLAMWAGLGRQPIAVRMPMALAAAARLRSPLQYRCRC